jgi:ATPase subunit of ABC transporter with duplicated ATPase domains
MTDNPTRVEVCCDPACENYNVAQEIPLTAEEIADMEAAAAQAAEEQAAREAEAAAVAEAKASAEAKLASLGLTAEEIAALSSK